MKKKKDIFQKVKSSLTFNIKGGAFEFQDSVCVHEIGLKITMYFAHKERIYLITMINKNAENIRVKLKVFYTFLQNLTRLFANLTKKN